MTALSTDLGYLYSDSREIVIPFGTMCIGIAIRGELSEIVVLTPHIPLVYFNGRRIDR